MHTYYPNLFITSNATRKILGILGRLSNCLPTPMLASQNHICLFTLNWAHMYLLQIQLLLQATLTSSVKKIKKIMAVFLKDYFGLSVNSRLSQDHSCFQLPRSAAQLVIIDTLVFSEIMRHIWKRGLEPAILNTEYQITKWQTNT